MSFWVVGLELKSSVEGGNGSIQITLLLENIAKVVMSLWVVGLELKSSFIGGNGSI